MTTATSHRRRAPINPAPSRADLTDAGFLIALCTLALAGFSTTFDGWGFLAVGAVGLILGVLIGHGANVLRQPLIAVAAMTVGVFFLLGGAVALRSHAIAGILPSPTVLTGLAQVSVFGWKELLTTLPPVDGQGPLLALPYILGLLCGSGGFTLARRVRYSAAPVAAPVAVLAAVILLGTAQPASRITQGLLFGCVALTWTAIRHQRRRPLVRAGARPLSQLLTAAALLSLVAGGTALLAPNMPGGQSHQRVVLRSYVQPPFDISNYPSPLVGFRKYTKDANQLWDQTLFTVAGLPAGAKIRLAVLNDYEGSVWSVTNDASATMPGQPAGTFQRVGARIARTTTGTPATLHVTIGPAYAAAKDINAWLPVSGQTTQVTFTGPRATTHTDNFRYNLATDSAVVPDRLQAGDQYTLATVIAPTVPGADPQPYGPSTLNSASYAFVASQATKWSDKADGVWAQVTNVAKYLHDTGAYSDGGPGQGQYLPGHSVGRLSGFLNARQIVGNDEQYAAAFALMSNQIGLPARVVLGAEPETGGVVKGQDVHAWTEVHLADGQWAPITEKVFMPDSSRKPNQQPPEPIQDANASVVPPPHAARPPSTFDAAQQADANSARSQHQAPKQGFQIPAFILAALTWGGPPLTAILGSCLLILGLKARRRQQRRTRGLATTRFAKGWRELVDHARDLGSTVPTGHTRKEQADLLGAHNIGHLAAAADAGVFGPGDPDEESVNAYWESIDHARRTMSQKVSRLARIRAAISLRSLRPQTPLSARRSTVVAS
jgi:transglutaminase-like putative cysteine protease